MAKTVLIVDDDPTQRRLIAAVLEREGFAVAQADGGEPALDRIASGLKPDAVILDLVMPHTPGVEVLKSLRAQGFAAPVIVLTAAGGVDTVVQAMQAGAQDFIIKPASPDRIIVSIRNALQMGQLTAEVDRLSKRIGGRTSFDDLVGGSAPMARVKALGRRAAKSSIPVLILGESGVGKELIARAVHGESERAGRPFVAVNCGAIPENLVESILFGHEKGSFTGAHEKHSGKFLEASGGTLFLDEVGELPLDMQVKLLRALQEGEIDPVGSKRPVKVDVRIVSATNRDLGEPGGCAAVSARTCSIGSTSIPSRRRACASGARTSQRWSRRSYAASTWRRASESPAPSPVTLAMLTAFDWPGNVRQLENAVYRAIVLSDDPHLQPHDFPSISGLSGPPAPVETAASPPAAAVPPPPGGPVNVIDEKGHVRPLEEVERDLIQLAIEVYAGRMTEVARRLGIGRSTLYRKVREQGLDAMLDETG